MKTYLKPLEISGGQFSKESSVILEDCYGNETSGFIENQHINDEKLEVRVIMESDNLALIHLPCKMLEAPGDKGYLSVKKEQLEYV